MFVEKRILAFVKFDVIESVLIGFNALVFDDVGKTAVTGNRFGILPIFGVDGFLDSEFENGVKMMSHLNENVFTLAIVLAIEVDGGVGGGA